MSDGANFFLKKALGDDFLQSLEKFELWKQGTKTVLDHEEIKTALKIVPRTVLSFLISHLAPMQIGETRELHIPAGPNVSPLMRVTKHEKDVYSGEIEENNKKVAEFKYRSIPGIGLVIMSAFELYDVDNLSKEPSHPVSSDMEEKVQKMIDERLALHDLIGRVIDKKIQERDAIQQLILARIPTPEAKKERKVEINVEVSPEIHIKNKIKIKKESPLKGFLDDRKKKLVKKEYAVELVKGEHVSCPDCGQNIFNGEVFSGCVCLGDDMDKKIYLTKAEKGFKVRFGKSWDPENIEMLLEVMRRKRG